MLQRYHGEGEDGAVNNAVTTPSCVAAVPRNGMDNLGERERDLQLIVAIA